MTTTTNKNARTRTVEWGWKLYKHSGYSLTIADVNKKLNSMGLESISERSYSHLTQLKDHGIQDYMPINHFAVGLATGKIPKLG